MGGGGPGGSTFSKEHLDARNGIHLGVAWDVREVLRSTGENGESVVDAVCRSEGRLGQIGVTELDGVREQQGLGDFVHDVKAVVVVEGGADVENVASPKFPGLACIGIVMNKNLAAEWAECGGIVAVGGVEVFPSGE